MIQQRGYGVLTVTDVTDGINTATIYLYQRTIASSPIVPTDTFIYTFSNGNLTGGSLGSWKRSIAECANNAGPLWVITANVNSPDPTVEVSSWSIPVKLAEDGDSIKEAKELYYFKDTSDSLPQRIDNNTTIYEDTDSGHWTSKVPAYSAGGTYYTCIEILLTDDVTKTWSIPAENKALTDSNYNALVAKSIAEHNEENAQGALSISRATQQHFWFNTTTQGNLLSGAYITDTAIDTFKNGKSGGYLLARSDGLEFGKGNNKFIDILAQGASTDALTFYDPYYHKPAMVLSGTNLIFNKSNSETAAAILGGNGLSIVAGEISLGATPSSTTTGFRVTSTGQLSTSNATIYGNIYANTGKIGGWNISSTGLCSDTTYSPASGRILLAPTGVKITSAVGNLPAATYAITAGSDFGVTTAGKLYATNAIINGNITTSNIEASGGTIGGWKISSNDFWKKTNADNNGSKYFGINATNVGSTNYVLSSATRTNDAWDYYFYVRGDGYLFSKSGSIGGWNIDSNSLSRGTLGSDGGMILCSTGTEGKFTIGNSGSIGGWVFMASNKFGVTKNGNLYASSVDISGKITANNGTIGGFTITSTSNTGTSANGGHAYTTSLYAHSGDGTYEYEVGMKGDGNNTTGDSGNVAFYVRRITKGGQWSSAAYPFYVTKGGTLFAESVDIKGKITGTSGSFSGTVTASVLKTGSKTAYNSGNGTYIDSSGNIYVGNGSTNNFVVDSSGKVTAKNIVATGGTIGRYSITSTYLMAGSGSTATGMGGDQAFFAGNSTSNSAPFRVSYGGDLVATKANIQGTITTSNITATGGKIAQYTIVDRRIESTGGGYRAGMQSFSSSATAAAFYAGCNTAAGGLIAGSAYSKFYVTHGGTLYTQDIQIGNSTYGIINYNTFVSTSNVNKSSFTPASSGKSNLGSESNRWDYIYTSHNVNTSDRKEKDNIIPITKAKEFILSLEPVNYYFKDGNHLRKHMGFIAQDVAEVCKKLQLNLSVVSAGYKDIEGKGYYGEKVNDELLSWGLEYKEFIAPMVAVIQDQQKEIEQLKKEITKLKNK